MNKSGSPPPGKGSQWIVSEILAAFGTSGGGTAREVERLSPVEVKELVKQALQEELGRLEGEEPSPPAPLPQAGEG